MSTFGELAYFTTHSSPKTATIGSQVTVLPRQLTGGGHRITPLIAADYPIIALQHLICGSGSLDETALTVSQRKARLRCRLSPAGIGSYVVSI